MNAKRKALLTAVGIALGLLVPLRAASAEAPTFKDLTYQWWQWALSIPSAANPVLDPTGADCVVGQHGSLWFLAGSFAPEPVTRTCLVPKGTALFFPVLNFAIFDTPNVCGQGPDRIPLADMRATTAAAIDEVTEASVEVDGEPAGQVRRVRSRVFAVALPEDNVFDPVCADLGGSPAGIFSPAVDDGYYAYLNPLPVGSHTLRIRGEVPVFTVDITYNLIVVPLQLH